MYTRVMGNEGEDKLEGIRKECGSWDEEMGCSEEYPDECPYKEECELDANAE